MVMYEQEMRLGYAQDAQKKPSHLALESTLPLDNANAHTFTSTLTPSHLPIHAHGHTIHLHGTD